MPGNEIWIELARLEDAYSLLSCEAVNRPDAAAEIRELLLSSPTYRRTALRALQAAPQHVIVALYPDILEEALATTDNTGYARDVILRLDRTTCVEKLTASVHELIDDSASDWEKYQRMAEILETANLWDLLNRLLDAAETSDDPGIIDVATEFRNIPWLK